MQDRWFTSSRPLVRVPGNEIITKFGGNNHIVKNFNVFLLVATFSNQN